MIRPALNKSGIFLSTASAASAVALSGCIPAAMYFFSSPAVSTFRRVTSPSFLVTPPATISGTRAPIRFTPFATQTAESSYPSVIGVFSARCAPGDILPVSHSSEALAPPLTALPVTFRPLPTVSVTAFFPSGRVSMTSSAPLLPPTKIS
ncbi:hypothetical protein HmCmsJML108_01772 [Escherichia coli]|nr:hypothetical protein HmCmsJML108_01772 [Escherichia coli]